MKRIVLPLKSSESGRWKQSIVANALLIFNLKVAGMEAYRAIKLSWGLIIVSEEKEIQKKGTSEVNWDHFAAKELEWGQGCYCY